MSALPPSDTPPARVAVIVPAYGVAHLVKQALASVQRQTLTEWQCIIIDDGAPDDVAGAVAPFLADSRMRLLQTGNGGVSAARNRAIAVSRAPLITLLDGEDLLRPTYLATMASLLEGDDSLRLATCNARVFGAIQHERRYISKRQGHGDGLHGSLSDVLDRSFTVYIGTTFRRADFDVIGGFDTTMAQSEDFDFWVRLLRLGGKARYVDEVLADYRIRPGSGSGNMGKMLLGNLRVYEKTLRSLPANAAERELLYQLIANNRAALACEHAIDHIIAGQIRHGLGQLRANRGQLPGHKWRLLLALYRLWPDIARPMMVWRRRAHSRGMVSRRRFIRTSKV